MIKTIVIGAGCFWCTEAVFSIVDGVLSTEPGYAGGHVPNPTYEQVCDGDTGHAEVVRIRYDDNVLPLSRILEIMFASHDPTSKNRQGDDVGEQYRSIIFYSDNEEEKEIRSFITNAQKRYSKEIVTEVKEMQDFYPAEDYHKDYFRKNPSKPYCSFVIRPKVDKVRHVIPDLVIKKQ
jgi:peptide-methionine (S)-S-oxide reductase